MSKFKTIGFDVVYPPGCKEVNEGIKGDELKRRLGDLMKNLENMSEDYNKGYDSLLSETRIDESALIIPTETKSINLQGLLLHLSGEQFRDHHDPDVQLRVAVCLCYIIKIECPKNPFLCYTDPENITQIVLHFLLKCVKELSRLRSKTDKLYLPVYTILSICCEIDIFHFYTTLSDGEKFLAECFHVFFDVIRRSAEFGDDTMISKMVADAMINLLSSQEASVSEALVTYLLNLLVDRCFSKVQKQVVLEIFTKCISKLEEQVQMVLQNYLIKNEKEEDLSESSENEEANIEDDDFCSLDSYKLMLKKSEKIKSKTTNKTESGKNTIEPNIEYGCHHVFQMIYEMFQISESIITPLLPTIEMKLRSTQVTDRKRACRLIGKLFASSASNDNPNHSSLWETFLGRLSDIEVEVREICVRVARDLLKCALENPDKCGIMIYDKEREDLVRAFQKRSSDQEETIRYLIVVAVSEILELSKSIVKDEELDIISEAMFKLLLMQSRDKFLSVRKAAHSTMGKLYRRIISDSETRCVDSGEVDLTLGLKNLRKAQKCRIELLLNLLLRPYLSMDVEDRIVVERLFNTSLVPYCQDSSQRMKSLLQCLTLCDEPSVLCIHEMFKTQVSVMNLVRQTMCLVGDVTSDTVMSPVLSQRLREKVKKLSEYLSSKDKVDSLTKVFNQARSDKKLNELLRRFVDKDSSRQVIVKTIMDIKKHLLAVPSKVGGGGATENSTTAQAKRKSFVNTVKCVLERGAPIVFDGESVQELLSHCVSTREALESSSVFGGDVVPLAKTLRLLHTMLVMSKRLVPPSETYEYLVSVMTAMEARTCVEEELCLSVLAKMVEGCKGAGEGASEEDDVGGHKPTDVQTLFGETCAENVAKHTTALLGYLVRCCAEGGSARAGSLGSVMKTKGDKRANQETKERKIQSKWRHDCKVAKMAAHCLVGLLQRCQEDQRHTTSHGDLLSSVADQIQAKIATIVQQCCECERYSANQPVMLTALTHVSVLLGTQYEQEMRAYATEVVPRLLGDDKAVEKESVESRNLSLWQSEADLSVVSQVRIQALKLLSRWVVTLRADNVADQKCVLYVMSSLRKIIGYYGTEAYSGDTRDNEMSHLRLAAGKCWLRVAQVQSFLSIFDVRWIHRLSSLVHDPCQQVRDDFLRKLHIGLYKLKLPLEYMAMFVFVPKVKSQEYLNIAKKYLQTNITRRREFLDTYPEYLSDAKKLFGVLPEYVLSFVIHMLAHDTDWKNIDDNESLSEVKHYLWFVMEPILKMNENYSFIRKLLERIKHAQDAAEPTNVDINEKLYICSDIALGLLISKQSTYDLKEYPVELKLPRTRYVAAPNTFFNPDFANILLDNCTRARIQFSPTPKSKQIVKNCMPAILIKGTQSAHDISKVDHVTDGADGHPEHAKANNTKAKKHTAKIVMGVPEMESEVVSGQPVSTSGHETVVNAPRSKRKISRSLSPQSDQDEVSTSQTSITRRGRVCKPNIRVMKDMVSPKKNEMAEDVIRRVVSPAKKKKIVAAAKKRRSTSPSKKSILDISPSSSLVRLEGNVSVNLERLISDVVNQTLSDQEASKTNGQVRSRGKQTTTKKRKMLPVKSKQVDDEAEEESQDKEEVVVEESNSKEVEVADNKRKRKKQAKTKTVAKNVSADAEELSSDTQGDDLEEWQSKETEVVVDKIKRKNQIRTKRPAKNIPEDADELSSDKQVVEDAQSKEEKVVQDKRKRGRQARAADIAQMKERVTRRSISAIDKDDVADKRILAPPLIRDVITRASADKRGQQRQKIIKDKEVSTSTPSPSSSPPKQRSTRHSGTRTELVKSAKSTPKLSQDILSSSATESTPRSSSRKTPHSRLSVSFTDSSPQSSQQKLRLTRSLYQASPGKQITDSTPPSSQSKLPSSQTASTERSPQRPLSRKTSTKTASHVSAPINDARSKLQSARKSGATKPSLSSPPSSVSRSTIRVAVARSPIEVVVRSKRLASQLASEELVKKRRLGQ